MEPDLAQRRQEAHALIDVLPEEKLSVVRDLLAVLVEPLTRSLANAPYDDEPVSEEERLAVAASKAWLKENEPIPHEEVLAEFGLTAKDFERMGREPLESDGYESVNPGHL